MKIITYEEEFEEISRANKNLLEGFKEKTFSNIYICLSSDEIMSAYLLLNGDEAYGVYWGMEGYALSIAKYTDIQSFWKKINNDDYDIRIPKQFKRFINKKIIECRICGEFKKGYGFEISFEEPYKKTIIIQSIFVGNRPKNFNECLRIGIGSYFYKFKPKKGDF